MAVPSAQAWGTVAVRLAADAAAAPGAPASVAVGDILWLRIEDGGSDASTGLPTVAGGTETWTQHPSSPVYGAGASRLSLYWARASQTSPTMPNIGGGVNHTHARVARTTGGKSSGNPWNGSEYASGNDEAANPTIPGFATAGADRLVLDFCTTGYNGTSSARFSSWTNSSLASPSITEWDDDCNTIGTGGGGGSAYGGMASAGTVGSTTVTEAFAGHSYIKVAMAAAADPAVINITHTAATATITGGTHTAPKTVLLAHTASTATITGGTLLATRSIPAVAGEATVIGGTHTKAQVRSHTAASATAAGGTHTTLRAVAVSQVAGEATVAGGDHTASKEGGGEPVNVSHTAGEATITGGTHTLSQSVIAYPDADITDGGWLNELGSATDLYASIDEIWPADDDDYIMSSGAPLADACTVGLSNVSDPSSSTGHLVRYRYGKRNATTTIDLTVRLLQGAVTIASWDHTDIAVVPADAEQTLTSGQADAITDYSDLRLQFEASEV